MSKITKQFTVEEYFRDYKYITNSHLQTFKFCPYLYREMRRGKVIKLAKDYFDYGKGVDAILSKEDINDKFFVGTAPKGNVEELRVQLKEVEDAVADREGGGKAPLKAQTTKIGKLNDQIEVALATEGKIKITETDYEHIKQSADELLSQPLYEAFKNANTQTIIATEINGIKVKCMLDKLDLENKIICDDKTTANIVNTDFSRYLQQLCWYRKIVKEVYGVTCDCYLAVADKNKSKNFPFKRSSLFYAPPAKLDYQEELNQELLDEFLQAKGDDNYPAIIENNPEMREERCFVCDHYEKCPHSRQKEFIIL